MHLIYFLFTFIHLSWIIKVFLFFLVGGFVLFNLFYSLLPKSDKVTTPFILFLLMMGLSPYLSTLILYYGLLLLPYHSDNFYLLLIVMVYVIIGIFSYKNLSEYNILKVLIDMIVKKFNKMAIVMFVVGVFFAWGMHIMLPMPIFVGNDMTEYAIQSKLFHEQKVIHYDLHRYDKNSGFYYVALHGFSFPLFSTLERMTNHFLDSRDYFFKSINFIYGILILLVFFLYSYEKTDFKYALLMSGALCCTYVFCISMSVLWLDNYRIFFVISSIYILVQFFNYIKDKICLSVFSLFLGAQANAHAIGFMLVCVLLFSLFLFLPYTLRERIKMLSYLFMMMLLFGGVHYILDIFFGTGWIFKGIKFF